MYDNPHNKTKYSFGNFDFGGGADAAFTVRGPLGKAGRLIDYGVEGVIEAFNGGTLMPKMAVGLAGTLEAYGAKQTFTSLAIATGAQSVRSLYKPTSTAYKALVVQNAGGGQVKIPIDTNVVITCYAATGSALTGQAVPFVIIEWDD